MVKKEESFLPAEEIPENDDQLVLSEELPTDEVVELEEDYGIFDQGEGMIAWSILNIKEENGKVRKKKSLRNEPPILRIEGSGEEKVDFVLTKEFTKSLRDRLTDVEYAFFGVERRGRAITSFKEALVASVVENPLRALLLGGLFILALVLLIV